MCTKSLKPNINNKILPLTFGSVWFPIFLLATASGNFKVSYFHWQQKKLAQKNFVIPRPSHIFQANQVRANFTIIT